VKIEGKTLVDGYAEGKALVLSEPLSFWGGVNAETGQIIDHSHPALGQSVTGRILVMPGARGSSSASAVLLEAIRLGTGPNGIVLGRADPILTVAAILAFKLYGLRCPIIVARTDPIQDGSFVSIGTAPPL
jgi:predicted aconitase with swiveling domain